MTYPSRRTLIILGIVLITIPTTLFVRRHLGTLVSSEALKVQRDHYGEVVQFESRLGVTREHLDHATPDPNTYASQNNRKLANFMSFYFDRDHISQSGTPSLSLIAASFLGQVKDCSTETSLFNTFDSIEERFSVNCGENDQRYTTLDDDNVTVSIYKLTPKGYELVASDGGVLGAETYAEVECPIFVASERSLGKRVVWGEYRRYDGCHASESNLPLRRAN